MATTLKQSVFAPRYKVHFRDVIFADILTSMARAFTSVEPLYCLVANGPAHYHCSPYKVALLQALPFWWRFMQCARKFYDGRKFFPDVVNAAKYSTAFPLIVVDRLGELSKFLLVGSVFALNGCCCVHLSVGSVFAEGGSVTGWWTLERIFFYCAMLNSLYSFIWDMWHTNEFLARVEGCVAWCGRASLLAMCCTRVDVMPLRG